MIGIYKITNLETGECYIGQSKNLEKRKYQHFHSRGTKLDREITDNPSNFKFEILEECSIEELNEKEKEYIEKYSSVQCGYNCASFGCTRYGERNSNSKLNTIDVINIRMAYARHENKRDVYEKYKDIISWRGFEKVWQGITWKDTFMHVYTNDNRTYYLFDAKASYSNPPIFTDEEVLNFRKRYVNETVKEIYDSIGGENICKFRTLEAAITGVSHKHIPIYNKREKKWYGY